MNFKLYYEQTYSLNQFISFALLSIKIYTMPFYFLDVVEATWLQRNSRDITILVIAALVALAAITGFIVWKKRKNKQP